MKVKILTKKIKNCIILSGLILLSFGLVACGKSETKDENNESKDKDISDIEEVIDSKIPNIEDEYEEDEEEYIEDIYRKSIVCTEEEGQEILFDTTTNINMLFVGNSLINTPQTDWYFINLINEKNLLINVESEVYNGYTLEQHLGWLKDDEDWKKPYMEADIILFQEYGGYYENTYENICEIIDNYCKEDVLVYYYTTEFDYNGELMEKIDNDKRIHVIDYGTVMEKLNELEFVGLENEDEYMSAYDYLHEPNDYHPNMLNGFLASAYIYNQLYKTNFDYTYDMISDKVKEKIPGQTEEEKINNYNMILDVINKGVTGK